MIYFIRRLNIIIVTIKTRTIIPGKLFEIFISRIIASCIDQGTENYVPWTDHPFYK